MTLASPIILRHPAVNAPEVTSVPGSSSAVTGKPATVGRVLHLINGEHYSGAERVQDLLALTLPDFGYEVGFACVKPGLFSRARKSHHVPLHELPMRSRFDLSAAWRVARLVRKQRYDIIHAHTPRSALIGRAASLIAGVPMIYHVHSPTSRDTDQALRNRLNALGERASLLGNVQLITVSESLGRHMRENGYREQRVSTVANGVPTAAWADRERPTDQWTLGTVALFRPRKGTEVLLDAIAILRRRGLPVRLRAVGPFETEQYRQELEAQVDRLDLHEAVDWVGFTEDVNQELSKMDLFVLPSLFGEGLPMVVLEAMAAGVPVVGTNIEGVPEAIRHGIDGLIAEAGHPVKLADAIGQVVTGEADWNALRTAAFDRHASHFSNQSMAAGVAQVYNRILGH